MSLVLRIVQVGVRTSVQAAVVQLPFAPVNPAWLHVAMGYVYTLETKVLHSWIQPQVCLYPGDLVSEIHIIRLRLHSGSKV